MTKVFHILFTGKLIQTIDRESLGVSDWVHDIAVYRRRESLGVRDIAMYRGRESLGVRGWVHDIAVYRDKVFLACEDGLRRYRIKY